MAFDRLLILCLAVALLLSILFIWLYPLPATRKQLAPCAKGLAAPALGGAESADPRANDGQAPPRESRAIPGDGGEVARDGPHMVRQLLLEHLPDAQALQGFTFERFSDLYGFYTKHREQWHVDDNDLKRLCMEHVAQWRFDHKLQLLRKYRMYMQAFQGGAAAVA